MKYKILRKYDILISPETYEDEGLIDQDDCLDYCLKVDYSTQDSVAFSIDVLMEQDITFYMGKIQSQLWIVDPNHHKGFSLSEVTTEGIEEELEEIDEYDDYECMMIAKSIELIWKEQLNMEIKKPVKFTPLMSDHSQDLPF